MRGEGEAVAARGAATCSNKRPMSLMADGNRESPR